MVLQKPQSEFVHDSLKKYNVIKITKLIPMNILHLASIGQQSYRQQPVQPSFQLCSLLANIPGTNEHN